MRIGMGLYPTMHDANETPNLCYDQNRPWYYPYWMDTDTEKACLATGVIGGSYGSGETPYETVGGPDGSISTEDPIRDGWGVEGVDWTWQYWNSQTSQWQDTPFQGTTPRAVKKTGGVSTNTMVLAGAALMVLMMVTRR